MNLDKKSLKLLEALDMDGRLSLSKLAKRTGMSKELASYKLKAMEAKGILRKKYASIDGARLGYERALLLIKYRHMNSSLQKLIIKYLENAQNFTVVLDLTGKWDMLLMLWVKNMHEYKDIEDLFMKKFGKFVREKIVLINTKRFRFKHRFIYGSSDLQKITTGCYSNENIDETDKIIIRELSKNCRTPTAKIAKVAGMSAVAVKNRIKSMEKRGIIAGYHIMLDTPYFGYSQYNVMLVLENPAIKNNIIAYLSMLPNVMGITEEIGEYDLMCEIYVKNMKDLDKVLAALREKFPSVVDKEIGRA